MSRGMVEQISLFRSQVKQRRLDDGTVRILESALASKDVKSFLEVRLSLSEFMRHESLCIIREMTDRSVEDKLSVLEFLVLAFALAGDVESCLALRYEALVLRELRSTGNQWLQVSYTEWMTFAKHSFDNGFYSTARKACENAISCLQMNGMVDADNVCRNIEAIDTFKRLNDGAVAMSSPGSVQAQATEYLKKKTVEMSRTHFFACKEAQSLASTQFRDGMKKHNVRRLQDYKSNRQITSKPDSTLY